jgi:hypothetical protein
MVMPTRAGATVNDALSPIDPFDPTMAECHCKVFQVPMMGGKTYTIDYMGFGYDPFLRIENEAGREVAADDDGGDGLNARLFFAPPGPGTYRVVCTTFAPRQTGNFTLIVREN